MHTALGMASTIQETREYFERIASELNELAALDQMEMYRFLTDTGKGIRVLAEDEMTEENFVQGCVSNVYVAHSCADGKIEYRGSSESLVVKGYLAILIEGLSGLDAGVLLEETRPLVTWFAQETNIRASLTPSRANAFGNIYELMVEKARGCIGA